ncbi:hypothetical protein COO60DRAFT_1683162 [Scenedesmus sp. NREL 46B-D3]|nr:hypothetical protein COO60DRAFT_1683162 [Scenedesmus sp. NREL 46B-D3]
MWHIFASSLSGPSFPKRNAVYGWYTLGTCAKSCEAPPPPPTGKDNYQAGCVYKSCVATNGTCVWSQALNGTACTDSGVNGTCNLAGLCQATGLRILYQKLTGCVGRIPSVLDITMAPGTSSASVTIMLTEPRLYADALIDMARVMFDMVAHGQQVVTITAPSQPMGRIEVSLYQGAGNAFMPVGGTFRADILLAATKTFMGARRCALLAESQPDSAGTILAQWHRNAQLPAVQAQGVALQPQCRVTINAFSLACPAGWLPKAVQATPNAHKAAACSLSASASVAAASPVLTGVCAGAPLTRPLPPDNTVIETFGPKFIPPATWTFHPGIDFRVAAPSWPLMRGHEGTVLYAPVTPAPGVAGKALACGDIVATAISTFLHLAYAPQGGVFAVATTIDPMPCFVAAHDRSCRPVTPQSNHPCHPTSISTAISPGISRDFDMFMCTRQVSITQDLDVALVVDVTGSFDGDLPVIRSLAPGLWQMLAAKAPGLRMALTTFQDFSDGAGVYQLKQNFTTNNATWLAAVNAMALGNGDDTAEAQLVGISCMLADLSWREAATRVMVLTTDAPFHTGGTCCSSGYGTIEEAGAALAAQGVKFVGLCQSGCDASQVQALVDAAGGAVMTAADSNSADIADKIYSGLSTLVYNITPTVTGPCKGIISFNPTTVPSVGTSKVLAFKEHVALPAGAVGKLQCQVQVMADRGIMATQNLTIDSGARGQTECRTVVKPEGVQVYSSRCAPTAVIIGVVAQNQSVSYDLSKGHQGSECPTQDKQCWMASTKQWFTAGKMGRASSFDIKRSEGWYSIAGAATGQVCVDCTVSTMYVLFDDPKYSLSTGVTSFCIRDPDAFSITELLNADPSKYWAFTDSKTKAKADDCESLGTGYVKKDHSSFHTVRMQRIQASDVRHPSLHKSDKQDVKAVALPHTAAPAAADTVLLNTGHKTAPTCTCTTL